MGSTLLSGNKALVEVGLSAVVLLSDLQTCSNCITYTSLPK